jgi:hypothetical protein
VSKKLQAKQERRLAEQRRREAQRRAARRGNLVTIGVAAAVVAVVAVLVAADRMTENAPVGASAAAANCSSIATHPIEGRQHVEPGSTVDYRTSPPTSGDHYPDPADPGFYSGPLPAEMLLHNLEHGQIVIWYRPDAPQETIDDLEMIVAQQPVATLAVPYQDLPGDRNLVLTAWGASVECDAVSQDAVDRFRERFQGRGPEQVPGVLPFTPE